MGVLLLFAVGIFYSAQKSAAGNAHPNLSQIKIGRVASIALLILFLLTMTFGVGSAWNQLTMIPGLRFIRAVSRIILIMIFPISILVAIACEKLYYSNFFNGHHKKIGLIFCCVFLISSETIFFQNSKTSNNAWAQRIQKLEPSLPTKLNQDAILFVAKDEAIPGYELPEVDAMVLAQDRGLPTINGYSGKFPPGNDHNPIERCISAKERLRSYAAFTGLAEEPTIMVLMSKIIKIPNISCGPAK
jgi:hypothetical protein